MVMNDELPATETDAKNAHTISRMDARIQRITRGERWWRSVEPPDFVGSFALPLLGLLALDWCRRGGDLDHRDG
jgi:hypothetical protein